MGRRLGSPQPAVALSISGAWSTAHRRSGRPAWRALLGARPDSARLWRELGDLARARELAVRAVELVGAAAAASDPGLHAQLALAECAIQPGGHAEASWSWPPGTGRPSTGRSGWPVLARGRLPAALAGR